MGPRRFVLVFIGVLGCLGMGPQVRAGDPPPAPASAKEEVFHYPLRSGDSLDDVSRIFGVPVVELVERNRIADPNRLPVGRTLEIPSSFGREVVALRAERDRLLSEKAHLEHAFAQRETAIATVDARVGELESTRAALQQELSRMTRWQNAAQIAALLLLGALAWGLKTRADRGRLERKRVALATENEALFAAKEKYRLAASQLELRYQKLYRGKGEAPREVIDEGIARLNRAFREAGTEVEALLSKIGAERERQEQLLERQKVLSRLFHPFAGVRS